MISIIDLDISNVGSVSNMLKKTGHSSTVISTPDAVARAEKIILPGVGSFDSAMNKVDELGLRNVIMQKAEEGTPILGICLGMQMLLNQSDEGQQKGLGLIDGKVIRFDSLQLGKKVPHMGWNQLDQRTDSPLLKQLEDEHTRFYFVHSFYADVANESDVLCRTNYGIDFVSGIAKGNVFGVQFHPEKSHRYGMQLISNFAVI